MTGGIQRRSRIGDPGWGHPTRSTQGEIVGMQIAHPRVARNSEVAAKLERVRAFRPREIIRKVVDRKLKILAVRNSLIGADERGPRLVCVPQNAEAFSSKSVMEIVNTPRAQAPHVPNRNPFAVIVGR